MPLTETPTDPPEKRYITRLFVAASRAEAERLASLDETSIGSIEYTPSVQVVHRTETWAWWSDGKITRAIGLPESLYPKGLSADAEELISDMWGASSEIISPDCGWHTLASINQVLRKEVLATGPSRVLERLTIEYANSQRGELFRFIAGHPDGYYFCEITASLPVENFYSGRGFLQLRGYEGFLALTRVGVEVLTAHFTANFNTAEPLPLSATSIPAPRLPMAS